MLALYNRWANERLYTAAAQLTPEALAVDRGAFLWVASRDAQPPPRDGPALDEPPGGVSPRGTRLNQVLHEDFGGAQCCAALAG